MPFLYQEPGYEHQKTVPLPSLDQGRGRALIVGERSPGGATVGNVAPLPNNAILVYPVARLLTPDGQAMEGRGVVPDIPVTLERRQLLAGIDAQLQAAIDTIVEAVR